MHGFASVLLAVTSFWTKSSSAFQILSVRFLLALTLMLGPASLFLTVFGQQTAGREIVFPTSIQWSKQKGVTRYRLQIAGDEEFRNVFYDGRVTGERYMVRGLSPGYYYWRIAPAELRTGAFSKPIGFFVSGGVVMSAKPAGRAGPRSRSPVVPTPRIR